MPSFAWWLKASWEDFRRRWAVMLAVTGTGGAATLAAGLLPFVPAAAATLFGVGPAWAVWGLAAVASVAAVLWLSTWAQAAMMRAAVTDEPTRDCLSLAWGQTGPFAWVLSLSLLAVVGGGFLFIVPGLILAVMLFAAPFCQIAGEAEGAGALGLSWARVKPHFATVALRLVAATAITAVPGWIPYVGWIIAMFWAPFGLIAMARLEKDLRAAEPGAAAPGWMGGAIAGLFGVVVIGTIAASFLAVRVATAAMRGFNGPEGLVSRVRPQTAQEILGAFTGQASDGQKEKAYADLLSDLRGPAAPAVSTGSTQVMGSSATWRGP